MHIAITGATGLVGRRLVADCCERGDVVTALTRNAAAAATLLPTGVEIVEATLTEAGPWQDAIAGAEAVVHLAGAGIMDRRWNRSYKDLMVTSRVDSTRLVAAAASGTFLCASAVGIYGDRGDEVLDESSQPGSDFLAELCCRWEAAAEEAAGRTVCLRLGVVLDPRGGALRRMLGPFQLGLGGPVGHGRQFMPWISWMDLVSAMHHVLGDEEVKGPVNAVAPESVTSREFGRHLGRVLGRPAILPLPRLLLRTMVGEVARVLVASQRVEPRALEEGGFSFSHSTLAKALTRMLRRE